MYDEAKRYAEAVATAYRNVHDIPVMIARIFDTFGPRCAGTMDEPSPPSIAQALANEPVTVHGTGFPTRSLCIASVLDRPTKGDPVGSVR